MKRIFLIAILATITFSAFSVPRTTDYVVTENGISYFLKVRYGMNANNGYLVCTNEDGSIIKYGMNEIVSFRKNGEVYKKNTIIKNGKPCENCEFMKLVRTRHGVSLYTFSCVDESGNRVLKCMVYKGDNFVLEVNEDNFNQIIEFFNKTYK